MLNVKITRSEVSIVKYQVR